MMRPAIKKVKVEAQSLNDYPGATWAYGALPLGALVNCSDIYGNGLTHVCGHLHGANGKRSLRDILG